MKKPRETGCSFDILHVFHRNCASSHATQQSSALQNPSFQPTRKGSRHQSTLNRVAGSLPAWLWLSCDAIFPLSSLYCHTSLVSPTCISNLLALRLITIETLQPIIAMHLPLQARQYYNDTYGSREYVQPFPRFQLRCSGVARMKAC
jgi:hypothetical protein